MTLPSRYAPTEAEERQLLAGLSFVGKLQAAFCFDVRNPIARVRSELHRVYPKQMAALDAKIAAAPQSSEPMSAAAEKVDTACTLLEHMRESGPDRRGIAKARDLLNEALAELDDSGAGSSAGKLDEDERRELGPGWSDDSRKQGQALSNRSGFGAELDQLAGLAQSGPIGVTFDKSTQRQEFGVPVNG